MQKLWLCLILCVAGGCTGYHAQDWTGGYSETWFTPNAFGVYFYGNAYTSMQQAEEMALLRAAELTVSRGYEKMAIMGSLSHVDVSQWVTGGNCYQTQGYVYMSPGGSGYVNTTTEYVPPRTITYHRPRGVFAVRCFDDPPDDIPEGLPILSADFIQESLARKYGVKRLLAASDRQ